MKYVNVENNKNIEYSSEKEDQFIFIGDKNIDSTMRVAVFGDIDLGHTSKDCVFYTSRVLNNKKLEWIHKLYFRLNKKIPLPFKKVWDKKYITYNIEPNDLYNKINLRYMSKIEEHYKELNVLGQGAFGKAPKK